MVMKRIANCVMLLLCLSCKGFCFSTVYTVHSAYDNMISLMERGLRTPPLADADPQQFLIRGLTGDLSLTKSCGRGSFSFSFIGENFIC